jgi:hypothetical protein
MKTPSRLLGARIDHFLRREVPISKNCPAHFQVMKGRLSLRTKDVVSFHVGAG